jgi:hypothetical protein
MWGTRQPHSGEGGAGGGEGRKYCTSRDFPMKSSLSPSFGWEEMWHCRMNSNHMLHHLFTALELCTTLKLIETLCKYLHSKSLNKNLRDSYY